MWPPPNRKGTRGYQFKKEADGSLAYTEVPLDDKGQPTSKDPSIVVEMSRGELEYLNIALSKDRPSENSRVRVELEGTLRKLDEVRKENEA